MAMNKSSLSLSGCAPPIDLVPLGGCVALVTASSLNGGLGMVTPRMFARSFGTTNSHA
jgi:hypothetical protein